MPKRPSPRFDIDALRRIAGDKVFARGEAYFRDSLVEILSIEPKRVKARVSGSEEYITALSGHADKIGGDCSCPAIENWGWCKHLVAVALAVNDMIANGQEVAEGPYARIRSHLLSMESRALAEMILELAERDSALLRRLDMAANAATDDDATLLKRFKKAINDATRTRGFVAYDMASGWAEGVMDVLQGIEELITDERAALALSLIDQAIERIEKAISNIDDSDGYCTELLQEAQSIHLEACLAAKPDPIALAHSLFVREVEGDWDTFRKAAPAYAEVLGEKGLAEFYHLAAQAWEKLPPLHGGKRTKSDFSPRRMRLEGIMDFFAERQGDVKARIAILAKDLSSPWRYCQLASFCLEQGLTDEALRWAEEGLWQFEDDPPDERLVELAVELLLKAKRKADAQTVLRHSFERRPGLDLYKRLCKIGGKDEAELAKAFLRDSLSKTKPSSRRDFPAETLIRILVEEKRFAEAWQVTQKHGATDELKEALAMASEKEFRQEALSVYAGSVDRLVSLGGNDNYERALRWVDRIGRLRTPVEQAGYVAGLRARFKAKRNFMKLLGS